MRLLHTSDWHLGATLCGRKRYDEGEHFLSWLSGIIITEQVETLVIAGDIFDSGTPSNRALELYYRFLGRVARSGCHHVIVTAGNHDSPTLLAAPKELLSALDIHVIGSVSESPDDQVFVLNDTSGSPALIVCAIPYLRDRDIRIAEPGETIDQKKTRLIDGICSHYQKVCQVAVRIRSGLQNPVPIVATGHLFVTGGKTAGDDGIRDLSIGNIIQIGADDFPDCIDYLALGHLHQPQVVGGRENQRYCGAPLVMGFGESGKGKEVVIADITPGYPVIPSTILVPAYRDYMQISGDLNAVLTKVSELRDNGRPAWVEVLIRDPGCASSVRDEIFQAAEGSAVEIIRVKNTGIHAYVLNSTDDNEALEELHPIDVFDRCLDAAGEPAEHREELTEAYREILTSVLEEDALAE